MSVLDAWLAEHHDPKWKYRKPYVKKLGKARVVRSQEFAREVATYEYHAAMDYRTIREPVSLGQFIAAKSDPKFKPYKVPAPRFALRKLSNGEARELAAGWAREVARLTSGKVAA